MFKNSDQAATVFGVGLGAPQLVEALSNPDVSDPSFWLNMIGGLAGIMLGYIANK